LSILQNSINFTIYANWSVNAYEIWARKYVEGDGAAKLFYRSFQKGPTDGTATTEQETQWTCNVTL
jgi:hypothetical protein